MIVLTAICAAVYVAVLIPFKLVPIIPGFTEVRPAAVVPIVCSVLFGPAAAWGSGLGNVLGDFVGGMFGPGSFFGFIGNFLLGYVPYKLFSVLLRYEPGSRSLLNILRYVFVIFVACAACSTMIGWGVDLLGFIPFVALANISFLNNFILNCILGPLILGLLYSRVKQMGLLYSELMVEQRGGATRLAMLGAFLMVIGAVGGLAIGNLIQVLHLSVPISYGLVPFVACMAIAIVLM